MDPIVMSAILAGGRLLLDAYFKYMEVNGMSREQIEDHFNKTKAAFLANDPAKLADV